MQALRHLRREILRAELRSRHKNLAQRRNFNHQLRAFLGTPPRLSGGGSPVTVMTYNVLATGATGHQDYFAAKAKDAQGRGQRETPLQYVERYNNVIRNIETADCDIVLLQEADGTLLNMITSSLLRCDVQQPPAALPQYDMEYTILPQPTCENATRGFGTAILFKKDKFTKIARESIVHQDREIYCGKNATLVTLQSTEYPGERMTFISVHMPGQNRLEHCALQLLRKISCRMTSYPNVILGGDFNCDLRGTATCGNEISYTKIVEQLTSSGTVLKGLLNGGETTCTFDYGDHGPKWIDNIFYSPAYTLLAHKVVTPECRDYNIWDAAGNILEGRASDHFPVQATFAFSVPAAEAEAEADADADAEACKHTAKAEDVANARVEAARAAATGKEEMKK